MCREFESNGNPAAARALMQSGLRSCPADPSLWLEYFRMVRHRALKPHCGDLGLIYVAVLAGHQRAQPNGGGERSQMVAASTATRWQRA